MNRTLVVIPYLAIGLVAAGTLILLWALVPVRRNVEQHVFRVPDQGGEASRLHLTISIGVAALGPGCDDKEALIYQAEANLMVAMEAGRNRVVHALDSDPTRGTNRETS